MLKIKNPNKIFFVMIPVYLLIIGLFLGYPLFETNDDVYIMNVFSGNITGEPYACTSYFHIFLGFIIATLYRIVYLPWFPIFIVVGNLLGQMAIYDAIYELYHKRQIIIASILSVFFLPISIYLIFLPSYTTSATLVGVVSIYCLFKNKRGISLAFLALSVAVRMYSGVVILGFWGLSYIYLHFKEGDKLSWKFIINGMLVILLAAGVYLSDEIIKSQIEPENYAEFKRLQSSFNDYGIRSLSDTEYQKLISDLGWDDNLFTMAKIYFSMDERITLDSFKELDKYVMFRSASIKGSVDHLIMRTKDSYVVMHIMLYIAISFIVALFLNIKNSNRYFAAIILLFALIGVIMNAQLYRVIARSLLSIILPSSLILIILSANPTLNKCDYKKYFYIADLIFIALLLFAFVQSRYLIGVILSLAYSLFIFRRKLSPVFMTLLLILSILNPIAYVYTGISSIRGTYADDTLKAKNSAIQREHIENYTFAHKDNIYVIGSNLSGDSRMINQKKPINHILPWGGTNVHSSAQNIQLESIGIKKYDSSILLDDNVYFLSLRLDEDDTLLKLLKENLKNKGYNAEYSLVDITDYIKVFKFELAY